MSHSTMTLPALYNYAKTVQNIDIFNGLQVPSLIDKTTLIDFIMLRSAPFEVCYPDPEYLQAAITTWGLAHKRTFDKWSAALELKYEPLHNYDRTERFTEVGSEGRDKNFSTDQNETTLGSDESNRSKTDGSTSKSTGLSSGQTSTANSGTDTTTNSVSAFDSATWQNSEKSELAHGQHTDVNDNSLVSQKVEGSGNENEAISSNSLGSRKAKDSGNESENVNNLRTHMLRAFGNIGVTTSMQLIQSELELDAWNLYEHITDMFLDEFCVLLY